ncbi:MAG: FliH/SctL family protein [Thermodesulfovibrionales bacterium]|nr:FliH/SctL family protein [Thermodesulfovibrionales bacterium]
MWYRRKIENLENLSDFRPPVFEESLKIGQRIEDIEREAYERGFEQGRRAGLELAEKEAKVIIDKLEELVTEFISHKEEIKRSIKPLIIELSVSIARKLIMKEIEKEPEIVVRLTEEAIKKIEKQGKVRIKINPLLKEIFEKASPGLLRLHEEIVIDIDPSLPPYSSEVISETQEIVTDTDEQLRNLIRELSERL